MINQKEARLREIIFLLDDGYKLSLAEIRSLQQEKREIEIWLDGAAEGRNYAMNYYPKEREKKDDQLRPCLMEGEKKR